MWLDSLGYRDVYCDCAQKGGAKMADLVGKLIEAASVAHTVGRLG